MNSVIKKSSVLAVAFIGLFVGSARAEGTVEVKVPFPFVVKSTEFPVGSYEIQLDPDGILSVRGTSNRSQVFALTMPVNDHESLGSKPTLVFTPYEKEHRLSEIRLHGEVRELSGGASSRSIGRAKAQAGISGVLTYGLDTTWK